MKKRRKSVTFIVVIIGLALLSGVGAASYIYHVLLNNYEATAKNGFYFKSDLLKEGSEIPVYDLYYDWNTAGETIPICVKLQNYISELNKSEMDIDYSVTASSLGSSQAGTLLGNTEADQSITLEVPCAAAGSPFEVTVTATANKPYKKILTGKFIIHPMITYSMDENLNKPVATLTMSLGKSTEPVKTVRISWPEGAAPDMTNPIVINASRNLTERWMTVTLNTASVYKLIFFKDSASSDYNRVLVQGA